MKKKKMVTRTRTSRPLFIPRWIRLLVVIDLQLKEKRVCYASSIFRKVPMEWAWCTKLLSVFEKYGWIKREKKGRVKIIEFTDEGKELTEGCYVLLSAMNKANLLNDEELEKKLDSFNNVSVT